MIPVTTSGLLTKIVEDGPAPKVTLAPKTSVPVPLTTLDKSNNLNEGASVGALLPIKLFISLVIITFLPPNPNPIGSLTGTLISVPPLTLVILPLMAVPAARVETAPTNPNLPNCSGLGSSMNLFASNPIIAVPTNIVAENGSIVNPPIIAAVVPTLIALSLNALSVATFIENWGVPGGGPLASVTISLPNVTAISAKPLANLFGSLIVCLKAKGISLAPIFNCCNCVSCSGTSTPAVTNFFSTNCCSTGLNPISKAGPGLNTCSLSANLTSDISGNNSGLSGSAINKVFIFALLGSPIFPSLLNGIINSLNAFSLNLPLITFSASSSCLTISNLLPSSVSFLAFASSSVLTISNRLNESGSSSNLFLAILSDNVVAVCIPICFAKVVAILRFCSFASSTLVGGASASFCLNNLAAPL